MLCVCVSGAAGDTWEISDGGCPGRIGNRRIYDEVIQVCSDCSNVFRDTRLFRKCRRNCFFNDEFIMCLRVTERVDELETFLGLISQLNAGRK
ncbi:hypothetical protein Pcinc_025293 [Petrolisthes cinctipes]|uniref:Molt-inhibiting hormone n=1 Tax=Petrolisthes cinctipes TaxID=88211 RepID=A0AAE1FA88_PETCI|nr:hypothetical protein Pcinc_025293 [Petrolisthes cinctipes]